MNNGLEDKRRYNGFTLIELLVVTVLVAMLAGAAGGLYVNSYKRRVLEATARELMLTVKYARVLAVEQQVPIKLVFLQKSVVASDTPVDTEGFYLAYDQSDPLTGETEEEVIKNFYNEPVDFKEGITYESVNIRPGGFQMQEDESESETEQTGIEFSPNGSTDAAVIVLGNGRTQYTVTVSAATGKVKMKLGEPEEEMEKTVDLDQ